MITKEEKSNKKEEWKFKKTREELIKMVERFMDKKFLPHIAMDIVDCIVVNSWEYLKEENKNGK